MGVSAPAVAPAAPPAALRQRPELSAYRSMWAAAPHDLAARHGVAALDVAGGTCLAVAAQSGNPVFCHAVGVGVGREVGDADLDRVDAFYATRGARY